MVDINKLNALLAILNDHPPLSQSLLKRMLITCVRRHFYKGEEAIITVNVCLAVAVLREICEYRNKYGLIHLPHEYEMLEDLTGEEEPES